MFNNKGLKRWSMLSAIGMFVVLLAGALVTKTGSGRGCGDDWPLCNGKFIPAFTIESIIEYNHRAITGVVGIIIVITFIIVWRMVRDRKDIRFFAASSLFFTILQAILGLMAVKWEQSPIVMALHFGISLLALASTMLLAFTVRYVHLPAHASGWGLAETRDTSVTKRFRNLVWFTTFYSYIVVYLGAYVRHTESGAGCLGWPLCNGEVIPELTGATAIVFTHRLAALALLVLVLWMSHIAVHRYGQSKDIRFSGFASALLIVTQILSGGLIALTAHTENLYLIASLLHNVVVSVLFGFLCYLSIIAWQKASNRS